MVKSDQSVKLLRICCWLGAVFDGLMAIPMMVPQIGGYLFGIARFNPSRDYRYAMMIGVSLMLGWSVLLFWGAQKPLERKGILLITAFPVLVGLILSGLYAVTNGMIKIEHMVPTWIIQSVLFCFFLYGYFTAVAVEKLRETQASQ